MRELAGRRLRYSIIASLLLHLLLLWPGVTQVLTRDAPSVLHATLKPPPQAQIEPAAAVDPPARAVAPAPTFAAPKPTSRQQVLERAGSDSVPPVTAPTVPPLPQLPPPPAPGASAAVVAPPSAAVPAAPAGATGAASGALITESNASGDAVDGLRGYRFAVAAQAVQDVPGIQAALVTVGEYRTDRVVSDRFNAHDIDIAFADLQFFLADAMAANFSRR